MTALRLTSWVDKIHLNIMHRLPKILKSHRSLHMIRDVLN